MTEDEIIERIREALAVDGTHTWEDVCDLLKAGQAQIFWNQHGAWITQIIQYPRARLMHAWVIAGELPGVLDLQEQVLDHARAEGIDRLTGLCRFGWTRKLTDEYGWSKQLVQMTREVEPRPPA